MSSSQRFSCLPTLLFVSLRLQGTDFTNPPSLKILSGIVSHPLPSHMCNSLALFFKAVPNKLSSISFGVIQSLLAFFFLVTISFQTICCNWQHAILINSSLQTKSNIRVSERRYLLDRSNLSPTNPSSSLPRLGFQSCRCLFSKQYSSRLVGTAQRR